MDNFAYRRWIIRSVRKDSLIPLHVNAIILEYGVKFKVTEKTHRFFQTAIFSRIAVGIIKRPQRIEFVRGKF